MPPHNDSGARQWASCKFGFVLIVGLQMWAAPGFAATFTVTTTAASGAGSLRQAILDANTNAGPDIITFNIGAGGAQTLNIGAALPTITDPVTIDGTTQPGYAGVPLITLDGGTFNIAAGLTISAGNSTVRGLVITRFGANTPGHGIALVTTGNNTVAGCLSLDATGTARRNRGDGVFIENCSGNIIGGIDRTGMQAVPNRVGIYVSGASCNLIGSSNPAERNVVSGNLTYGLEIAAGTNNTVRGNWIGTDVTGANALGNGAPLNGAGVSIQGVNNLVGGLGSAEGNVISGNANNGLEILGQDAFGNVTPNTRERRITTRSLTRRSPMSSI